MSRVPMSRWARIGVWTGAAVTWGSSMLLVRESAPAPMVADEPPEPPPARAIEPAVSVMPTLPNRGLVVIRYTPIAEPEPEVITRYVTLRSSTPAPSAASASGSGGSSAGTVAPPPPAAPAATTATPAPSSGGS